MKACITNHCDKPATRKGLCPSHYMKEYRRQQKRQAQANGSYDEGYEAGLELGISIGQEQVTQTLMKMLESQNANCFVDPGNTLHLEVQGQTFRKRLSTTHE